MVNLRPNAIATTPGDELRALSAPVSDPLWMLARQWQIGGLLADDAGTPVHVRLAHRVYPVTLDGEPLAGPLEPAIEAEPAPAPASAALAAELFRRLRDAGVPAEAVTRLRAGLAREYPLTASDPDGPRAPYAGRLPDAAALAADVPDLHGADPADLALPGVRDAVRDWLAWVSGQLGAPAAPSAWRPERMEYSFELTAELPGGPVTLSAEGYDGTGSDWYTFNRTGLPDAGPGNPAPSVEVRPAPVTYPGMPRPRYWEMEDGNVNLDALAADDPAHALLRLFAHTYANDWFVVPLSVPSGAGLIDALEVTDTFGIVTPVVSTAEQDGPGSPWALWELSTDATGPDHAAGLRLHLPCSPPPLEGRPVEDVLVARDEMANLAWLIELVTGDPDGAVVDRYRRWLSLRPASDPWFAPADTSADYRLGTPLPDYWHPLMAVTGPQGRLLLALAGLPPGATEVDGAPVEGVLLRETGAGTVADDVASRAGTRVTRTDRLLRVASGLAAWRARIRRPGGGEASSGLRFDVLR
jgi:hypothetical protein